MPMYNLIEYSFNYKKTFWWQYSKDLPAVYNNGVITDFNGTNSTSSFTFKAKLTCQTEDNGTKNVE